MIVAEYNTACHEIKKKLKISPPLTLLFSD